RKSEFPGCFSQLGVTPLDTVSNGAGQRGIEGGRGHKKPLHQDSGERISRPNLTTNQKIATIIKASLPGLPSVTAAIGLRRRLRRSEPNSRKLWTKICTIVFPGYALLPKPEQRELRAQLRQRTRWRLAARARRRQRIRGGISCT